MNDTLSRKITRWNSRVHTDFNFEDSVYHYEHKEGEYVMFSDHLAVVEVLEYELRTADELIADVESDRDYWKAQYQELYGQQQL